jgi:hypothetical protein
MKKITRKELRQNTEETLRNLLAQFEIASPSKRTEKVVEKVSRSFSSRLKQEIKKQLKRNQKATKKAGHNGAKANLKSVAA